MPAMRRIDKGIVRAEMRSGNEDVGPIPRHTIHFRHGAHGVLQVLDDMRQVNARELAVGERPRVTIQIPDMLGGGIRGHVDAHGVGLDFALAAPDVQSHRYSP
jgi:hypothetical protein